VDESPPLVRYFQTVRAHIRLIVACVVVCLVAAIVYVQVAPRSYTATSEMVVNPASADDTLLFDLPVLHSTGDPTQDVLTAASLLHAPDIAAATIRSLHLHTTTGDLLGKISIVPFGQSNIVSISADASSPSLAQRIADAYATEAVAVRTAALHKAIAVSLPGLRATVARLPTAEAQASGGLGQQLSQLEQLQSAPDPTVGVSSTALLPGSPTSPKRTLSIGAGLLVGLLLGIGTAFGLDALDPTVRREEQLRIRFGYLPVLARIPHREGTARPGPLTPLDLPSQALEQYRQLRASLNVRSGSERGSAFLLTGTTPGEGKTTSAINLAAVLAQSGLDVILIEGDLRRPTIGRVLNTNRTTSTESVLDGRVGLAEALQEVRLGPARFRLLAARGHSADHANRLTSTVADELVESARALADVVIVDSPPLTAVVDALAFAATVDRVVLAVRIGHTKLSKLSEATELLETQGAPMAGVILIDVPHVQDFVYGYTLEHEASAWRGAEPVSGEAMPARIAHSRRSASSP
jgi:capsular exopolysaccharide synthesis family protein